MSEIHDVIEITTSDGVRLAIEYKFNDDDIDQKMVYIIKEGVRDERASQEDLELYSDEIWSAINQAAFDFEQCVN